MEIVAMLPFFTCGVLQLLYVGYSEQHGTKESNFILFILLHTVPLRYHFTSLVIFKTNIYIIYENVSIQSLYKDSEKKIICFYVLFRVN